MGEEEEQVDVLELVDGRHHQGHHEVGLQKIACHKRAMQQKIGLKKGYEKDEDMMIIELVFNHKQQGQEDYQEEAKGEEEQFDQSDSEEMYLVRKPGEAEEEDDDDEHLDDPLLVGQHRPIPHSVPLARCPVECHQNEADLSLANLAPQSLAAILEHSIVSRSHYSATWCTSIHQV